MKKAAVSEDRKYRNCDREMHSFFANIRFSSSYTWSISIFEDGMIEDVKLSNDFGLSIYNTAYFFVSGSIRSTNEVFLGKHLQSPIKS
jgi:hypothetical protein